MEENVAAPATWLLISKHPITLLLLTTLLTSWLVPYINKTSARATLLRESRLKRATEILADSVTTDRLLNRVLTTLESFHKDMLHRPEPLDAALCKLREHIVEQYEAFNGHGWWWFAGLDVQARVLGVGSLHMDGCLKRYRENLERTTQEIDCVWHKIISRDYDPQEPSVRASLDDARRNFQELALKRGGIVGEMAGIFYSA